MDRFGFNKIRIDRVTKRFLTQGIKLAQEEIKQNFDTQSEQEHGKSWNSISYRNVPPPILNLKGKLKFIAINGKPSIVGNTATLTIDPLDDRGKGYASYHQDGINQFRSKDNFQREFVTQSKNLENKQVSMLIQELDKEFT
ncbi:MAG: hypothetical protein ABIS69_09095 [Sediminibacterium sp.]